MILLKRVGVECRHHAATAQVNNGDQDLPDAETASRPSTLVEPNDTSDHQIGPQTSTVASERGDRAVGRNQQRENIKAVHRFVPNEACAGAHIGVDQSRHSGVGPAQAIDDGRSLRVSDRVMSEKSWVGPRSDDTASADSQRAPRGHLRYRADPLRLPSGAPPASTSRDTARSLRDTREAPSDPAVLAGKSIPAPPHRGIGERRLQDCL